MKHRVPIAGIALVLAVSCLSVASARSQGDSPDRLGECRAKLELARELVRNREGADVVNAARAAVEACEIEGVPEELAGEAAILRTLFASEPWEEQLDWIVSAEERLKNAQVRSMVLVRILEKKADLLFLLSRLKQCFNVAEEARDLRLEIFGEPSAEALEGESFLAHAHVAAAQVERPEYHRREAIAILEAALERSASSSVFRSETADELRGAIQELRRDLGELAPTDTVEQ